MIRLLRNERQQAFDCTRADTGSMCSTHWSRVAPVPVAYGLGVGEGGTIATASVLVVPTAVLVGVS